MRKKKQLYIPSFFLVTKATIPFRCIIYVRSFYHCFVEQRQNTLIGQRTSYDVEHVLNVCSRGWCGIHLGLDHPILNAFLQFLTIPKTYRFYVSIQPISAVQFFVVRCSTPSIFILVMVNYHPCCRISLLAIVIILLFFCKSQLSFS